MKIFLDTANLDTIKDISKFIKISGVTTNPSLIAKERVDYVRRIEDICEYLFYDDVSVSIELISTEYSDMVDECKHILEKITLKYHNMLAFKVPMTLQGLRFCKVMSDEININMTLIFSLQQAILAINNGAKYISPFIGRIDDIGYNGLQLIYDIREYIINNNIKYKTNIIGASVRSIEHIAECGKLGCDIVTIPPKLIYKMIHHPLTTSGLEKFMNDYREAINS